MMTLMFHPFLLLLFECLFFCTVTLLPWQNSSQKVSCIVPPNPLGLISILPCWENQIHITELVLNAFSCWVRHRVASLVRNYGGSHYSHIHIQKKGARGGDKENSWGSNKRNTECGVCSGRDSQEEVLFTHTHTHTGTHTHSGQSIVMCKRLKDSLYFFCLIVSR